MIGPLCIGNITKQSGSVAITDPTPGTSTGAARSATQGSYDGSTEPTPQTTSDRASGTRKRPVRFTLQQREILEGVFKEDSYPTAKKIADLSAEFKVEKRKLQVLLLIGHSLYTEYILTI